MKYKKLSRSTEDDTVIMGGHTQFTVEQLETEVKMNSDLGKKIKQVDKDLEERY